MNPLTLGVYAFHEQLRLLLREPPPGRTAVSIARVVIDGVDDKQLLQAIRLYENADANLHSFTLHTEPIGDERSVLVNARRQLQLDADAVRACFKRAGQEVAKHSVPELTTLDGVARAAASLAASSSDYLDGLVVGVLPTRIEDAALFQRLVRALLGVAKHPRLVVLVKDDGTDALKRAVPHEIALRVDQKALWAYMRDPKGPNQAGPPRDDVPRLTPEARQRLEQSTGQRIITEDNGRELRHLIIDAGQAFAEGKLDHAAKKFRLARTYCQLLGLQGERAICAISIGTARFAGGQKELALRAYEEGREIAARYDLRSIEMQAHLGIASTLAAMGSYSEARDAYEKCSGTAVGMPAMQIECQRMRGLTFALENRTGEAVSAWLEALATVEGLPPLERMSTSYRAIADHLAEELPKVERTHEVPAIRRRVEVIAADVQQAIGEARSAAVNS